MYICFRVRPLCPKEIRAGDISVVSFPGNGQILVSGTHALLYDDFYLSYLVLFVCLL